MKEKAQKMVGARIQEMTKPGPCFVIDFQKIHQPDFLFLKDDGSNILAVQSSHNMLGMTHGIDDL